MTLKFCLVQYQTEHICSVLWYVLFSLESPVINLNLVPFVRQMEDTNTFLDLVNIFRVNKSITTETNVHVQKIRL